MPRNILILGGTGFVGRSLCERLMASEPAGSLNIVVPSRRPQRAMHLLTQPGVNVVQGDVHDPDQLQALVAGSDAVINLVAILHGDAAAFEKTHVTLVQHLIAACEATRVHRLLHVSALGVGHEAASLYLRSKTRGEALLREAQSRGSLDTTVLRPSVIFGEHDRFINLFADLCAVMPFIALAGAEARFQPVWVEDVAQGLCAALAQPATSGQIFEAAGPRVLRLRDIVQAAGAWSGHERPIVGLPGPLATLQAGLMECLPGTPLMSRDNLASMRTANVASKHLPGLAELGVAVSDLQTVMRPWLAGQRGPARLDKYRQHAQR